MSGKQAINGAVRRLEKEPDVAPLNQEQEELGKGLVEREVDREDPVILDFGYDFWVDRWTDFQPPS